MLAFVVELVTVSLSKEGSFTVHHYNIQMPAIELHKVYI